MESRGPALRVYFEHFLEEFNNWFMPKTIPTTIWRNIISEYYPLVYFFRQGRVLGSQESGAHIFTVSYTYPIPKVQLHGPWPASTSPLWPESFKPTKLHVVLQTHRPAVFPSTFTHIVPPSGIFYLPPPSQSLIPVWAYGRASPPTPFQLLPPRWQLETLPYTHYCKCHNLQLLRCAPAFPVRPWEARSILALATKCFPAHATVLGTEDMHRETQVAIGPRGLYRCFNSSY